MQSVPLGPGFSDKCLQNVGLLGKLASTKAGAGSQNRWLHFWLSELEILQPANQGMRCSSRSLKKRSKKLSSVAWYSRKPSLRLLLISVNTSIGRPRSASVCHADASTFRSPSTSLCLRAISAQEGAALASCNSS